MELECVGAFVDLILVVGTPEEDCEFGDECPCHNAVRGFDCVRSRVEGIRELHDAIRYEGEIPALAAPREKDALVEELADRKYQLIKGSLIHMIAAALDEPIDWDDVFVSLHFENWHGQFNEALAVADERLTRLAPDGLPIWED